jgi:AraC-like DNA-binding protein
MQQHECNFRAVIADGEVVVLNDDYGVPPGLAESVAERVAAKLKHREAPQGFPQPIDPSIDRLYTLRELAAILQLDVSTVRRIFCDETGVITLGKTARRDGKRDYQTYRIPRSVLLRKYPQLKRT